MPYYQRAGIDSTPDYISEGRRIKAFYHLAEDKGKGESRALRVQIPLKCIHIAVFGPVFLVCPLFPKGYSAFAGLL